MAPHPDPPQGNLTEFASYVERHRARLPAALWQQTPPQHFLGWQGEYPGGSPPFECRAIPNVTLAPDGTLHASEPEHAVMERVRMVLLTQTRTCCTCAYFVHVRRGRLIGAVRSM